MPKHTTLELVTSRGLTILLDGKRPNQTFSMGESDTGYTCNKCEFGSSIVTEVDFGIQMEDYNEGADPHTLTAEIDGEKVDFKVEKVTNGAQLPTVTLTNGETRDLSEHEAHIIARR